MKFTIDEAFQEWFLDCPEGSTLKDYKQHVRIFLRWLRRGKAIATSKTDWSEVCNGRTLVAYRRWLEKRGLSLSTLRHRLFVLNAAMQHISEISDGRYPELRIRVRPKRAKRTPVDNSAKVLQPSQIIDLLRVTSEMPHLHGGVLLQVASGLRCMEAFNVHCDHVGWDQCTVSVKVTSTHIPKTDASIRTIPVAPAIINSLLAIPVVERYGDWPVTFPSTNPGAVWSVGSYGWALRGALKRAGIVGFQPRWLRATFGSMARQLGCDRDAIRVYMGHSMPDTFGSHYEHLSPEFLSENIAQPFGEWFAKEVLAHVQGPVSGADI